MNELQTIPFHTDTVYLVEHDGQPYVPVRPIIENIGIDWATQSVKLNNQKERWSVGLVPTVAGDGKQREMLCLPLRKLAGFLYNINSDLVRPDLKEKVMMYQNECDEVLWNYWTKGVAVNDSTLRDYTLVPKDEYIAMLEEQVRLLKQVQSALVVEASRRKNFTAEEDTMVLALHAQGLSQSEIGKRIGRKKDSVGSCLRRLRVVQV